MKKYLFILTIMLCFNTAYSQVLYSENFDNFNWGYLGTDPTGKIPGQGGWLIKSNATQSNTFFTIVNEPNRGKVLDITAMSHAEGLYAIKTGIDQLISNRTPGNDVIKFEIDYFTGPKQPNPQSKSWIKLLRVGEIEGGAINPVYLCASITYKDSGIHTIGAAGMDGKNVLLPFNTWIKIITYLDYTNRKAYFEIPSLNIVHGSDFLTNVTSTNLIQDYKPATISLNTYFFETPDQPKVITRNKYDNIQITALKEVPPNVIALSTNEQLATKFNLYPNPATNVVNITNAENMQVNQITVYTLAGKQVSTQAYNNPTEIQLNVEHLASGTYLLYLQTAQGTAVKQFIKK
ncbi:T9SS type A sorting domain-containing protein [Myroides sp. JBRI-B21084]|uniref:T9SS type A sorting domain-containing protein n=1 Tax=Myroides sp. JBRI-B21084 TaxID=3119977 RepID=UPI0026E2997D|nr:T9SS type A sorting domain-containing protein [Paenimyroides cloacae]WKW46844.1 T9SS type A sorting domain-containing protein [Paenimyroides cloacae]